jgi:hypothetical protein
MTDFRPMIRRTRKGQFELRIPSEEREVLRSLPGELRELLATDDPALARLFPPAHPDDPGLDAEYRDLTRGELLSGRLTSLQVMEATIDAERLDEEQLLAWLGAVNDLRLVLGTRLDVTEETPYEEVARDDPRAPAFVLYVYLGVLEEEIVDALAAPLA